MEITKQTAFSMTIRKSQLNMLGEIITNPAKQVLRRVTFHGDSFLPETAAFVRRIGRPRQNWTEQLMTLMAGASKTISELNIAMRSECQWNTIVERICNEM